MRIHLELNITGNSHTLPINYQYPVASWIYQTIHSANPEFSAWLHEQGYSYDKRRFKLFTFSPVKFEKYNVHGDRITSETPNCSITLSFLLPEGIKHFIAGCFQNQQIKLGDKKSQVDFEVRAINMQSEPEYTSTMRFRCMSPICISEPMERNGKLVSQYLSPEDEGYEERFFNNLKEKYKSANPDLALPNDEGKLTLLSKPRSKLITIKQDSPAESKVRGYEYDFEMKAAPELMAVGYLAGFGEKNSMGMGCSI